MCKHIPHFVLVFFVVFSSAVWFSLPRPRIDLRWMLPKDTQPNPTQVNQKTGAIDKQTRDEIEKMIKALSKTAFECSDRIQEMERGIRRTNGDQWN